MGQRWVVRGLGPTHGFTSTEAMVGMKSEIWGCGGSLGAGGG